jgi:hypothetical protein
MTDMNTGAVLLNLDEPNVPVQWGATTSTLILKSEGYKQAFYGQYLSFSGGPGIPYAAFIQILPAGTNQMVTMTLSADQLSATLNAFSVSTRPFSSRLVNYSCTTGTTTILPAAI